MRRLVQLALAFSLIAQLTAAAAAPIYRCGPDGREYSQTPCPGGKVVEATDPRSAAQRAEGRRIAAQERKLGVDLAREREKATAQGVQASLSGAPSQAASDAARGKPPKKPRAPQKPIKPLQPIKSNDN